MRNDVLVPEPKQRPLIGRSEERSRLITLLEAARSGQPGIALIGGDAGAGKTRLLQEMASIARSFGAEVLVGSCVQVGDFGLPYLPIIDALRTVQATEEGAAALREEVTQRPALARLLPQLIVPTTGVTAGLGEEVVQGQLFEGVHRILSALAETAPVLLILEDVHWADRSTRDLMSFLVRTLREGRIVLLASFRADDVHRRHPLRPLLSEFARLPHVAKVNLSPFTRSELAQFIDGYTGSPVDPQVIELIFQRSEGNAFFAEELTRAYVDGAAIRHLPTTLADVLLTRVEELSPSGRDALRVAAVAGRRAGYDLLLMAAEGGDTTTGTELGLREAVEAGLLTTDGESFAFRHALMQEAIYADLLPGERVRLHSRFAQVLGSAVENGITTTGPAELAHHLLASHDLTGALNAVLLAASQAEKVAAPAEALVHLEQALALFSRLENGADRLDLLVRAADAAAAIGELGRAVAHGRAAVQVADSVATAEASGTGLDMRIATRERLARLLMEDDQDAAAVSAEAVDLASAESPSRLRAMALATRSRVLLYSDPAGAQALLDEAIETATAAGADAIAADAIATKGLMIRRNVVPHEDPNSESLQLLKAAVAKAGATQEALYVRLRVLRFLAAALMEDGDLVGALAAADEGVVLADRAGLTWSIYGLDLQLMRGWVWYATGRWDEVLAASLHAVYAPTAPGRVLATQAVAVLVARGDETAEELLPKLRAGSDFLAELQLDLSESVLLLEQGLPARAVELTQAALARIDDYGWDTETVLLTARAASAHADLALAARAAGQDSVAVAHSASASALAQRALVIGTMPTMRGPYGRSWVERTQVEALRATGHAGPPEWERVYQLAEKAGRQEEQLYAQWRQAEAALALGVRSTPVIELLSAALTSARRLKANPMIRRIEELIRRARLTGEVAIGGSVPSGDSPLTARELDVVRLVSQGLSNKQIGAQLFISNKTASVHVSNILAKLQASSRTEAATLARQQGLLGEDR